MGPLRCDSRGVKDGAKDGKPFGMAEVVNLNRVRKRKAREAREQTAAEQRLRFGRKKSDREAEEALARLRDTALDGHRRVREDET